MEYKKKRNLFIHPGSLNQKSKVKMDKNKLCDYYFTIAFLFYLASRKEINNNLNERKKNPDKVKEDGYWFR